MTRGSWFAQESNEFLFSQYVSQMDSWQEAMADDVIDAQELQNQADRVTQLLQELEPKLSDELHEEVTQALFELAVFYGMVQISQAAAVAGEGDL